MLTPQGNVREALERLSPAEGDAGNSVKGTGNDA